MDEAWPAVVYPLSRCLAWNGAGNVILGPKRPSTGDDGMGAKAFVQVPLQATSLVHTFPLVFVPAEDLACHGTDIIDSGSDGVSLVCTATA